MNSPCHWKVTTFMIEWFLPITPKTTIWNCQNDPYFCTISIPKWCSFWKFWISIFFIKEKTASHKIANGSSVLPTFPIGWLCDLAKSKIFLFKNKIRIKTIFAKCNLAETVVVPIRKINNIQIMKVISIQFEI